jgi:hypothetical protein
MISPLNPPSVSETFGGQALSALSDPPPPHFSRSSFYLGFRLYAHALLCESRIFPGVELCDESPDYMATGFTDIWKGNYHGELVCIKAVRADDPTDLKKVKSVRNSSLLLEVYSTRSIPEFSS